jgi:triosephosphate isomerase
MKEIYVNLKRFEVPRSLGGLCPLDDPVKWIESVITDSVEMGLGGNEALSLVYLLPESLIPAASDALASAQAEKGKMLGVGCQGVHWDNITVGGNFGAFTSALPATSAKNLGCTWAIIGHSEERRFKGQVMRAYDSTIDTDMEKMKQAAGAVDALVQSEVQQALETGLNVLLCVGESAEERGEGVFEEQKPRIEAVLKEQLLVNLDGVKDYVGSRKIVIGYEPIWAIGPGKTPPGEAYISFVSAFIKDVVHKHFDFEIPVVYGGGLKEENARMIAGIETIDGGLVALTRFTGEIGFDVPGLKGIVDKYLD